MNGNYYFMFSLIYNLSIIMHYYHYTILIIYAPMLEIKATIIRFTLAVRSNRYSAYFI